MVYSPRRSLTRPGRGITGESSSSNFTTVPGRTIAARSTASQVFELRVFQLRDGDVRGCVVPADLAVDLDIMADMSEPVPQAYLNALALCETESVATLWVHDPLGLFPPSDRPEREL